MMKQIQMVDLGGQYNEIAEEIRQRFDEIFASTAFINGPAVQRFSKELETFLGTQHVIPCGNGTDALQIALMALGLRPGDEVIVPAFTFVASVEVIALLGMTPVVVDVDPNTFNLNVDQLPDLVTDRTRAIMPVHLFGQCSDMEPILQFAGQHNLYVIEDNAQSIGASYTFDNGETLMAGTMGDIGSMSFYPSKNLGAYGDAGALCSDNESHANLMRSVVNHGMSTRYYHDRVGVNSRLDAFSSSSSQCQAGTT